MGLDQIVFVFLIVFALRAVFASNLKHAIISSSVFGLWASLVYLMYHAPDVAVSEAVVASSLGTVLLILTIRNYNDITVPGIRDMALRRTGIDLFMLGACVLTLFLTTTVPLGGDLGALRTTVMETFLASDRVVNPVTSILLHFRVFDTVLEALMLLIAVLGVMHLTDAGDGKVMIAGYGSISSRHATITKALQLLTPILIVVALGLIVGDPLTPGGGFQGAGLLAAVLISRYLVGARGLKDTKALENLEKAVFVVFVSSVALYILLGLREVTPEAYAPYMLAMNGLLGVKVFCGLSIMFVYFAREA